MLKDILKHKDNYFATEALVLGKSISDRLIATLKSDGLKVFVIEYTSTIKELWKDKNHIYINTGLTSSHIARLNKYQLDLILIQNIETLVINFDIFSKTILPLFHKHTNCYIDIFNLNDEYVLNLISTLNKNDFIVEREEKILKIKIK